MPNQFFCNKQSQTARAAGDKIHATVFPWQLLIRPRWLEPAPASGFPLTAFIANPSIHRTAAVFLQLRPQAFLRFSLFHFDQLADEFRIFQPGGLQQTRKSRKELPFSSRRHDKLNQHPSRRLVFENALDALKGLNCIGLKPLIHPAFPGREGQDLRRSVHSRFKLFRQSLVRLAQQDDTAVISRGFDLRRYILLLPNWLQQQGMASCSHWLFLCSRNR
ncbi:hypothetical protein D1872_183560 [compost metagenome]